VIFSFSAVFELDTWRLLRLEAHDAFTNMAIDEAVLNARVEGSVPDTLRFYRWKPSAVSVGKFQQVEKEVQIENCRLLDVDIVRRITGGGTVYHDADNEITYSVVAGKDGLKAKDIADVYAKVYSGLVETLRIFGVTADFGEGSAKTCPNLTINDRKISGSAQCHKRSVVLQHGTILVKVDFEKMFTCLRVPWAESCMQVARVAKSRITSLQDELGKSILQDEMCEALIEGFQRALDIKLVTGELTGHERAFAERLRRQKYSSDDWIFQGRSGD
jgi:lipoate-protein ligase A